MAMIYKISIILFSLMLFALWGLDTNILSPNLLKASFENNTTLFLKFCINSLNSISLIFAVLILCFLFKNEVKNILTAISKKISEIKVVKLKQLYLEASEVVKEKASEIPHKNKNTENRLPIDKFMHSWINFEKIFMKGLNGFNIKQAMYERYKTGTYTESEYEFLLFILQTRHQVFHGENIVVSDEVYLQMSDFLDNLSIVLENKWKQEDKARNKTK